ncbi:MAG: hypothetical protein ACI4O7_09810 [Aristaeellaceae bacterium]
MKRILATLCAGALLLPGAGVADTLSAPMTPAEMEAIWQESFGRMHTTAEVNPSGELPGAGMLDYPTALALARQTILDTYGTPEEELDAMGVYPDYYEDVWHLYFTPLNGVDVDADHDASGVGEYRVYLSAATGEVEYVNWYIDDFWPLAQRVWDAGKRDVVYDKARTASFYQQSQAQQEHFRHLLADAGYDMSQVGMDAETLLASRALELLFADPAGVVQPEDDPLVAKAWAALEEACGVDGEAMRRYAYVATYSPLETGTTDICISYNYEVEALWQEDRIGCWDCLLFSYARRLGLFMVQLDEGTGEVVNVVRAWVGDAGTDEPDTLLGKTRWTAEDFAAFDEAYALRREAMDAAVAEGRSLAELEVLSDRLMRELGGDPEVYGSLPEEDTDIGVENGWPAAWMAAAQAAGMEEDAFRAAYQAGECRYCLDRTYEYYVWGDDDTGYRVVLDASTGEVISAEATRSNG